MFHVKYYRGDNMKLVIDIDRVHLDIIKKKVEEGNTQFYPFLIIAKGKPLSEILYHNSWEEHVNMLKEIYNDNSLKDDHWIYTDNDNSAICSSCKRLNKLYGNYCKWCGAKQHF